MCLIQGLQPPCYDNTYKMVSESIATLGNGSPIAYVDLMLLHFPPILGCGGRFVRK